MSTERSKLGNAGLGLLVAWAVSLSNFAHGQAPCPSTPIAVLPSPGAGEYMGHFTAISDDGSWVFARTRGAYVPGGILSGAVLAAHGLGTPHERIDVLVPQAALEQMNFGSSVACSADGARVVIGARANAVPGAPPRRAYVFHFDGNSWNQEFVTSNSPSGWTGHKVAMNRAGDLIAVADPTRAFPPHWTPRGAVDMYRREPSGWTLERTVEVGYGSSFAGYIDLSGDGNILAVRVPGPAVNGSVWLFERQGGAWNQIATLSESVSHSGSGGFGTAIALDYTGNTVAIGNYGDWRMGYQSGAVFIFRKSTANWILESEQLLPSTGDSYKLGYSVAINSAGDRVLAGAPGYGFVISVVQGSGAVFEYARTSTGLQQANLYFPPTGEKLLGFGHDVQSTAKGEYWTASAPGSGVFGVEAGIVHLYKSPCADTAVYCTAQTNSLGCTPQIAWAGAAQASKPAGFEIRATGLRNQRSGLLFYSTEGRSNTPWSGGTLCVRPPLRRTGVQNSGGSSVAVSDCSGVFNVDFNSWMDSSSDPAFYGGQHVFAQYYSRDPSATSQINLTDAIDFYVGL